MQSTTLNNSSQYHGIINIGNSRLIHILIYIVFSLLYE